MWKHTGGNTKGVKEGFQAGYLNLDGLVEARQRRDILHRVMLQT